MPYLIAPAAISDIDEIWSYILDESGSQEIADRLTDTIYSRILLLASFPYLGRGRSGDMGEGMRSFLVGEYVIVYWLDTDRCVHVLRVVHGRRDLEALFGH